MICPFYGKSYHVELGVLLETHGNQCAIVRVAHAPCTMEMRHLPVEWAACLYRRGALPATQNNPACMALCSGCGLSAHACEDPFHCDAVAVGLCPNCLRRAEQLATEAAGQQRLIP